MLSVTPSNAPEANPSSHPPIGDLEEFSKQLVQDVKDYYIAYKKYKNAYFGQCDDTIYVVHKPWLKQWKKYSKTKLIKRGYDAVNFQPDELEKDYPGPITNQKILKSPNNYIRDDNENDITNQVIKSKASSYLEYKLIPKESWDILLKRFGGGPELIRHKDSGYYSYQYEVKFNKVSFYLHNWLIDSIDDTPTAFSIEPR